MPFRQASRVLEDLLGVYVSPETARRLCEAVGKQVEEKHTAEAQQPWKEEADARETPCRMAISADGAMVPVTGGAWAEVRTLAIGDVPAASADTEEVHVGHRSSVSRMTDAAHFTDRAEVETSRRQVVQAKEVGAVRDGADWLPSVVEIHRADAVRLLDVPHAAEHRARLLDALNTSGLPLAPSLLERCVPVLKHRGPSPLARMADRLTETDRGREDVREHLGSVRTRLSLMPSPTFRRGFLAHRFRDG